MKSYTADKSDLEELLADAELEDRKFVAEKQNVVIISSTSMNVHQDYDIDKQRQLQWNILTIPKRYNNNAFDFLCFYYKIIIVHGCLNNGLICIFYVNSFFLYSFIYLYY